MNEVLEGMNNALEENLKEVAETAVEETVCKSCDLAGKISVSLDDLAEQVAANTRDIYNMNTCWNKFVDSVDKQTIEDLKNHKSEMTPVKVVGISALTAGGLFAVGVAGYLGYTKVVKPWMDKKKAPKEEVVADQEPIEE